MSEDMKARWASIEKELQAAMSKLSDAIQKMTDEMPEAAKAINEEYLRMQEKLDNAVDRLRKK